jgi:uncharacterized RDD family membrane protein YckC
MVRFILFNFFTRKYLNNQFWLLKWNKRATTLLLEMWYIVSVFVPYLMLLALLPLILGYSEGQNVRILKMIIESNFLLAITINKDFFGGQSPVHRMLGYQVLNEKTNLAASKVQCVIRNLTLIVFPIELVILLISSRRRLGDFLAGTILADVAPSNPEEIVIEIEKVRFDRDAINAVLISVAVVVISECYWS